MAKRVLPSHHMLPPYDHHGASSTGSDAFVTTEVTVTHRLRAVIANISFAMAPGGAPTLLDSRTDRTCQNNSRNVRAWSIIHASNGQYGDEDGALVALAFTFAEPFQHARRPTSEAPPSSTFSPRHTRGIQRVQPALHGSGVFRELFQPGHNFELELELCNYPTGSSDIRTHHNVHDARMFAVLQTLQRLGCGGCTVGQLRPAEIIKLPASRFSSALEPREMPETLYFVPGASRNPDAVLHLAQAHLLIFHLRLDMNDKAAPTVCLKGFTRREDTTTEEGSADALQRMVVMEHLSIPGSHEMGNYYQRRLALLSERARFELLYPGETMTEEEESEKEQGPRQPVSSGLGGSDAGDDHNAGPACKRRPDAKAHEERQLQQEQKASEMVPETPQPDVDDGSTSSDVYSRPTQPSGYDERTPGQGSMHMLRAHPHAHPIYPDESWAHSSGDASASLGGAGAKAAEADDAASRTGSPDLLSGYQNRAVLSNNWEELPHEDRFVLNGSEDWPES